MGTVKTGIVVILIALAIFFGLRLLSPEDSWVCDNGNWVQHGHPDAAMPTTSCSEFDNQNR